MNSNDTLKDSVPVKEKPELRKKHFPTPFPVKHGLSRKEREFNYNHGGY